MAESLTLFCDGSCLRNGYWDARAGYAVLVQQNGDEIHRFSGQVPKGIAHTNQRAELYALQYAINYLAESGKSGDIYTDSKYSIQCISEWALVWRTTGWIKHDKKKVQNLDIIKPLHELWMIVKDTIRLHHIPAHTGGTDALSQGNAVVDALARAAAESITLITDA